MQILIMRHGHAVLDATSDAARALSSHGITEVGQISSWLAKQKMQFQHVIVSPYLRAQQTWNVLSERFSLSQQVETLKELTPNGDVTQIRCYLELFAQQHINSVLVISHLPLVEYLVTELCPNDYCGAFSTATVACIELSEENGGRLLWQVSPKQFSE